MIPFVVRLRFFMVLLAAVCSIGSPAFAATPIAAPLSSDLAPVLPDYRQAFGDQLAAMPRYVMDLLLDDATSTLSGTLVVTVPNETGTTLDMVPFRLYPNASYYDEGETTISRIEIGGVPVEPRFDDSGTVLFVDLPHTVGPNDSVTITLDFSTVVPQNAGGSYGILNHDVTAQRFVLADWYPIVAGRDETGWRLEPPTDQGDPTFSSTSLYETRLALPAGYDVIATGEETRLDDGSVRIVSGPVREFAQVATQGLESLSSLAGETTVSMHSSPDHRAMAEQLLDIAVATLAYYNEAYGAYPFQELDIVETDLALAYGVSWSGLVFIDETQVSLAVDNSAAMDFTLFHELGHQWWGATVGANSNDHTFLVEGLTNATAVLAQAAIQGPDAATNSLYAWMVTPYLNMLAGTGDAVADVSIFEQPVTAPLSTLAYGKGGLGFLALRNQIGDAAFQAALAAYADQYRLGIAEPSDLLAAFEAASGQSLQALWTLWFESADVTPGHVEELVPQIIASF